MDSRSVPEKNLPRRQFVKGGIKAGLTIAAAPAIVTSLASCGTPTTETPAAGDGEHPLSRAIATKCDRLNLAHLPTPLEPLRTFSDQIGGPQIFIKRDDQTGLAFGGNKTRKLEFIMADAVSKGADVFITTAGLQSNWCRQSAAAARIAGMECALVLAKRDDSPTVYDGNLLLDYILGAEIRVIEPGGDRSTTMEQIAEEERKGGRTPYVAPVGGSRPGGSMERPLGAVAYAKAFIEIHSQARDGGIPLNHVVVATGSGGTQAGLVVGAKAVAPDVKIIGISVSGQRASIQENVAQIANETAAALELNLTFDSQEVVVFDEYVGEGYGILYREAADAIARLARQEGILLDPVYTAKAMAGLIDLSRREVVKKGEGVVFIHTGGTPALFPYRDQLMEFLKTS